MRRGRILSACLTVLVAAVGGTGVAAAGVDPACGGAAFAQDMLAAHNQYRAKHGAPAMVLDPAVSASARRWAEHLADTQKFEHSQGSGNGENLAVIWGSRHTGFSATKAWYDEIKDYNFDTPTGFSRETGHFTQVVWKASTKLGVGVACNTGGKGGQYVVAQYNRPGNMMGDNNRHFRENVQRP
ncbi:CAP family protein [Nocardia carnea]|uniref:CAP family protein n=1 Tax=Nocardia carnea TaxID=37328 RepID=UPI0024542529|nr:CAP family protein [Nocardia carnea]